MKLEHKNIFITGSSRGIGLAIAHKFAQAGANIVFKQSWGNLRRIAR